PPADPSEDPDTPGEEVPEEVEPVSFEGKRITIIQTSGAGGAADFVTRFLAEHLGDYLPGNPTIVVENQPGGGGAIALNHFYNNVHPDGLTLAGTTGGALLRWVTGQEGHDYDPRDMRIIGNSSSAMGFFTSADLATNAADLFDLGRPIRVSHRDLGGIPAQLDSLSERFWGLEINLVTGYDSYGSDARLAVMRGEVDGSWDDANRYQSVYRADVEAGRVAWIYQSGLLEGEDLIRDPRIPEVPTIQEAYEDVTGSPAEDNETWPFYEALIAARSLGYCYWLPPGTPDEIYDTLVGAFRAMAEDHAFQQAAEQTTGSTMLLSWGDSSARLFRILSD
ncbi:MAG: hypothetical protein LOD87_15450, partial [Planifilum fulgidum]